MFHRVDLKNVHWEWQGSNPLSATAREGFRPGLYGRLDGDLWFHTTVTNVQPTAKQSYVIHYRVRPPSPSASRCGEPLVCSGPKANRSVCV